MSEDNRLVPYELEPAAKELPPELLLSVLLGMPGLIAQDRQVLAYDMVLPKWPDPDPRPFPLFRDRIPRRTAEEQDRREWLEGVRRRLGLVAEVHRCDVFKAGVFNPRWVWCCERDDCSAMELHCPSWAEALAAALAHARAFVPEPPEPEPWTELDVLAFEAAWDAVQAEQERFAAAFPRRVAAVAERVNETFGRLLPDGMRFEWEPQS